MLMDNAIFVDGKEFISAVRASKKIGYSRDYIGQLCRAKKIPGKLIGKTWYVDYSALTLHRKTRKLGKKKKAEFQAPLAKNEEAKPLVFIKEDKKKPEKE